MAVRVNFRPAQFVADDVSESQRRGAGPPGGTVEGRLPPRGAHIDAVVQVAPRCGAFCEQGGFADRTGEHGGGRIDGPSRLARIAPVRRVVDVTDSARDQQSEALRDATALLAEGRRVEVRVDTCGA